jgi:putative phosphoesterase
MKIAVVSDSHKKSDYTKEALTFLKQQGASYVIHAGDLELEANLKTLEELQLPYVTVFGNNDSALYSCSSRYNIRQEPYLFKINQTTFKLMHLPFYLNGQSDVVIYGHTHYFEHEYTNKTLFLNPGELCARNKPLIECVLLEINENEYIIHYYSRHIEQEDFEKKEIRYKR